MYILYEEYVDPYFSLFFFFFCFVFFIDPLITKIFPFPAYIEGDGEGEGEGDGEGEGAALR